MHPETEPSEPLLLRKRHANKNSTENSNNMEAREEHKTKQRFKCLYGISAALGITLAVLVLVWTLYFRGGFAWQSNPALEFNWHPLLMVFGMICLYSQSLLIFRTGRNFGKKPLKICHMSLNLLAYILSVIGLKAAFDSHNLREEPIPNLYSLHSWIGLVTVIIFAAQFVIGFTGFLFPGYPNQLRATVLPVHVSFGKAIFFFAIIAAVTGILEKALFSIGDNYSKRNSESYMVNFIGLILVCFGALVLYLVNEQEYKRVAIPEDQINLVSGKPNF